MKTCPHCNQPVDPYAHLKAALAAGKVIQEHVRLLSGNFQWQDMRHKPEWLFEPEHYRIKPEPVPWDSPEDVPGPVCWIRNKGAEGSAMVTAMSNSKQGFVTVGTDGESIKLVLWKWRDLVDMEHSTTRRADDWHPCTKEAK